MNMNKLQKNETTKLYNMIMPIWLLLMMPYMWWVSIIGNFLIDLLTMVIFIKYLSTKSVKITLKRSVLKVYGIGFVSDIIGCIPMIVIFFLLPDNIYMINMMQKGLGTNPFSNVYAFLITTFCLILSGMCIYILNYKFAFNKTDLSIKEKKKIALAMAIFTAPYLFYLPTNLLV